MIIWDLGLLYSMYYVIFAMNAYFGFMRGLATLGNSNSSEAISIVDLFSNFFNGYMIVFIVLVIIIDLIISQNNKRMLSIGIINLIYYAFIKFNVPMFSTVTTVLLIIAAIYGLRKEKAMNIKNE